MTRRFFLAVALALAGSIGLHALDETSASGVPVGNNLVSVLPAREMPLDLSPAKLLARENGAAVLLVNARNTGKSNINKLVLIAFVYDATGSSKGFYSFGTHQTIDAGQVQPVSIVTKGVSVTDGDHIVIAPMLVATSRASWEIKADAMLLEAVKAVRGAPLTKVETAVGEGMQGGSCGSAFCTSMHALCRDDCEGKGGIKEWSCNLTECSFTCICG